MRIAHLIMAYRDPQQVERLIRKLHHPGFDFYIHIDKKSEIEPFLFLSNIEGVYFIQNRIKVRWAGYSFTRAVFQTMSEVLSSGEGVWLPQPNERTGLPIGSC